ncbi:LysR family transcriptional regulator [Trinickia dinghuensis]|uniref:LysR family transcriptional regulator n=1 Tax=Trinickia dinghuensis TaxID=2291023 RepID=A0A3D8K2N8_9BURK|nr:LysR family transcriptional regulator [Trinickia dinghuensis]RDU98831.1 LysR family transcriptional regulator [Trinickia dinghuensis]
MTLVKPAPSTGQAGPARATTPGAPTIVDPRWFVFLQVSASGSLSRAAAALDMPQSMVSRNVAQLEQQCGERLFRRTGRGVVLTEFGEQMLPRVTRLAAEADALADDIRSARGQPAGEVLLGLLPSAVNHYAGPLFAAVRAELPAVRLHLTEAASAQLEEHLREGRLDMAVVLKEDEAHVGDSHVLARVPLHLVGPRGDPVVAGADVPLAMLSGLPLVVPGRPHLLRARLDRLASQHDLTLHAAVEVDSVRLQYEVVAAGGGYAIASVLPGKLDARLASSRIVAPVLERFVVLAESPRRPHTRATRAVRRLVCGLAEALEDGEASHRSSS